MQLFCVDLIAERHNDKRHKEFLGSQDNFFVRMFCIYPERLEGLIWITNFTPSYTLLIYGYAESTWRTVDKKGKCEGANKN